MGYHYFYKMDWRGRVRHCCSYTCYMKLVKLKEENKLEELDKLLGLQEE